MTETIATSNDTRMTVYTRAFAGLMLRDFRVLTRELMPFLVRVAMNPLLFLFVFTYVMPHMSGGGASPMASIAASTGGFGTVLLPGLMAVAIMFSGIAAVALPLAQEFGITREIDDRVMCPLPIAAVAAEKIVFSAIQSVIAAALVFPLAYYIPSTPVKVQVGSWLFLIVVIILASLVAGALGLTIGTSVQPKQIGLIFGVVVVPITFLGCVYYPWALLNQIPWLQYGVLVNPIVYMSEGLRSSLTPSAHMPDWLILTMLVFFLLLLTWVGMKGFARRVLS
ncbi:ABC transporter permease [Granulicella sp. 5B5]|uniref:ABC transporter permease n=1 Tax=Granulicella sp. 5B5 TaxID=1617967 RepID=UPI0015F57DB1|nr:ABC transporter permease [Granulicella sp. 5B5]QMV19244.1 ABC transporter permease [Granulicella sp. 5B5]